MQSKLKMFDHFIVSPLNGEKFITSKKLNNDRELITNTSLENAIDVNRIGIVEALPINYKGIIQVGDKVVVHFNVFRDYFDGQGITRHSNWHIKDNLFKVEQELIYLVIRGEEIIAVDNFAFIKPIFEETRWEGIKPKQHIGILRFNNPKLQEKGIFAGDKIVFKENAECEYELFDEVLFRMRSYRVLAKLTC